jgi:hypothetical protein
MSTSHIIENCSVVVIKNGTIYIRGTTSFQGKMDKVYLIRYNEESKTLLLDYGNISVQTVMPKDATVEYFMNTLPSYFFNVNENSILTCFNMHLISFVQMKENTIFLQFSNGIPVSLTVKDASSFVNICSILEYI